MNSTNNDEINVLMVEDNDADAYLVQHMLSESELAKFNLSHVDRLSKAINVSEENRFDVILLDLYLPDSQEFNTFTSIQSNIPGKPIIVLTGFKDEKLAIKTVRKGAQDYLIKGEFDSDLIVRSIKFAIERSRAEKMKIEKKKIQKQLLQAQKLEVIATLIDGVVHDFNNYLGAIQLYTELSMTNIEKSDPLYNYLQQIHYATSNATNLTRQLLLFSKKKTKGKVSIIDVNKIIEKLVKMIERLIGENITVETHLESDVWKIMGDEGTTEQIVMNLVVNARDAMPEGGRIVIETVNVFLEKNHNYKNIENIKSGKYVCLRVTDNGIGIKEEQKEKIFEPFYSTKEEKGTGLGLSVVYGIVQQYKGCINIISEKGQGTTFEIFLPASQQYEQEVSTHIEKNKIQKGSGQSILFIEDEKNVRQSIAKALIENGYNVYIASNATEAYEVFDKENGQFDLVFSDVVLPDINGIELVEDLLSRNPDLDVLMHSGYLPEKSQWKEIETKGYHFLQKPYSLYKLFETIKAIISKK